MRVNRVGTGVFIKFYLLIIFVNHCGGQKGKQFVHKRPRCRPPFKKNADLNDYKLQVKYAPSKE